MNIERERIGQTVDPRGIEPLSPPCHGDILPVNYGPRVDLRGIEPRTRQCE